MRPTEVILEDEDGTLAYWEYPSFVWVMDIRANRRGGGIRLMRKLKNIVAEIGKPVWAQIKPTAEGMSEERLRRWYERHGAEFPPHPGTENALRYQHG